MLRDANGNQLLLDDDSGVASNARIFFTPSTTGTYFIDASAGSSTNYGLYGLTLNASPIATAVSIGASQSASIGFAGDTNLHGVTLQAGVAYGFSVDGTTLLNPFLELLDANGAVITTDDDSGSGNGAYLSYTPASSGQYYLAARESGNNATGAYVVRAWQLPTVSISDATVTEGNAGTTNLVFTVSLSAASPVAVSVFAATLGGSTATSNVDFASAAASVSFAAGQTSATFTVAVSGDTVFEPSEVLTVNLSGAIGALIGDGSARGFIVDNDSPYVGLPNDPFRSYQWYLYDTQGVNVFPVWASYTGKGIRVVVFDQGVDATNSDLSPNVLTSLGRNASDLSAGGAPILSSDNHGTAVAGVIAAAANGSLNVGVAYDAKIVPIYSPLSGGATFPQQIANAFTYAGNFDVLNNSWGTGNQFFSGTNYAFYDDFGKTEWLGAAAALKGLADNGRGGLGTIVVQSAGNALGVGDEIGRAHV